MVLWGILKSAVMAWKQPQTICCWTSNVAGLWSVNFISCSWIMKYIFSFHLLKNAETVLGSWMYTNMPWARFGCWARVNSWTVFCCCMVKGRGLESDFLDLNSTSILLFISCMTLGSILHWFCFSFLSYKIGPMLVSTSYSSCEDQMRMPGP